MRMKRAFSAYLSFALCTQAVGLGWYEPNLRFEKTSTFQVMERAFGLRSGLRV